MKLTLWDNGNDIVIAESAEAARELAREVIGSDVDDPDASPFEPYAYDTITLDPDEIGVRPTTYTREAIVSYRGRGYLCSRDY